MPTRRLSIRLALEGSREVAADIKRVGTEGEADLKRIKRGAKEAGEELDILGHIGGSIRRNVVGLAAAFGVRELVGQFVDATREASRLRGTLVAGVGDAGRAGVAFQQLTQFSLQYGESIDKLAEGFTGLAVRGINPTMERLKAYASFAAAIPGKDVGQFVEAVADTIVGEYERLQEFGIKARNEGDKVAISFGGTTVRVKNNAEDIAKAFEDLGRQRFGSALDERLKTLDAQANRVSQSWKNLLVVIGNTGVEAIATKAMDNLASNLQTISHLIDGFNKPENRNTTNHQDVFSANQELYKAKLRLEQLQVIARVSNGEAIVNGLDVQFAVAAQQQKVDRLKADLDAIEKRAKDLSANVPALANRQTQRQAELSATGALTQNELVQLRGEVDPNAKARAQFRERAASLASAYGADQISGDEYERFKRLLQQERDQPLTKAVAEAALSAVRSQTAALAQDIEARSQALEATLGAGAERTKAKYLEAARVAEQRYGISPGTLGALLQTESQFNPAARSKAGAVGIAQFLPSTAASLGVDPSDPFQSIEAAGRYLAQLKTKYGSERAALAAYNGGGANGQRVAGGMDPNNAETRDYLAKIEERRSKYASVNAGLAAVDRQYLDERKHIAAERLAVDLKDIDSRIDATRKEVTFTEAEETSKNARLAELDAERRRRVAASANEIITIDRDAAIKRVTAVIESQNDLDQQLAEARADLITNERAAAEEKLRLAQEYARRELAIKIGAYPEELAAQRQQLDAIFELRRQRLERERDPLAQLADHWEDSTQRLRETTAQFASDAASAIAQFAVTGKGDFKSFAQSIIADLTRIQIQAAAVPFLKSLGGFFTGAAANDAGFVNSGGFGSGIGASYTLSALGNVFSRGNVVPFARGGIVTRPTVFPMARGAGMMAERGPEAIMPLARDATGSLGVRAQSTAPVVNVQVINNGTPQQVERTEQSFDGEAVVVRLFVSDVQRGGPMSRSIADAYGLRRGGG